MPRSSGTRTGSLIPFLNLQPDPVRPPRRLNGPPHSSLRFGGALSRVSSPCRSPWLSTRETVYSYISRLAATWRTDVADLAHDMGASFKKFTEQDPAAFEALAEWAGLDQNQLDEMLSWTGVRAGVPPPDFETPDCDYAASGIVSIWSRRNWAGERWPCRSISQHSL